MSNPPQSKAVPVSVLFVLVALTILTAYKAQASGGEVRALTQQGAVLGKVEGRTDVYRGIPYASPPIGDLRWRAPQPPELRQEVFDASTFGAMCPQGFGWNSPGQGSEDCLILNVWTPAGDHPSPLPVMVWIHGGGFRFGSSHNPTFNGQALSEKGDVVVVSFNYRLDILGFLALPELAAESPLGSSGSYGFLDQVAALKWVQDNIAAFRGDAENITIFGESAGSVSVCQHLAAPMSRGLFQRAIMQSGGCFLSVTDFRDHSLAEAYVEGHRAAKATGCATEEDVLSCLRSKAPIELFNATAPTDTPPGGSLIFAKPASVVWKPSIFLVDGVFLTQPISTGIIGAEIAEVPVIIGTTRDESTSLLEDVPESEAEFRIAVVNRYGDLADEILGAYPLSDYDSPATALAVLLSDELFTCPTFLTAQVLARAERTVYLYRFEQLLDNLPDPWLGVFHTSELAFIFGNDHWQASLTDSDHAFSDVVMDYWLSFVKNGDPNTAGQLEWPNVKKDDVEYLILKQPLKVANTNPREQQCDFWSDLLKWPKP